MALNLNPALDLAYIDQAYGDDPVILYMIFDAFLSDSLPRWRALELALETDNKKEAASIVHGLKPSFTMAGLTGIRPRVEILERAIKDNETNDALMNMYVEINTDINVFLPILEEESARLKAM
ncbi:Hpt domain-containing protein [Dyadobacter sp. Leaf189]|uniref:Hpt domain-containing protein n=1 Tax=Dyadobacter sp. Leaf189 TaxID=1736295 RepID=UPI0006F3661F|nr:Hpt domain-containing protein [Dyadobacter sp. Leaf189]KQS26954.1 histidine phosphotransferase [Dyadobacter sp. Leaf189]